MTYPPDPSQPPPSPYGQQPVPQNPYGYPQQPVFGSVVGMPDRRIGWVVVAFLSFLPVGVLVLLESNKVEERWRIGDVVGAQQASDNVKKWSMIALFVHLGILVLCCLFYVIFFLGIFGLAATNSGS